MALVMAFIFYKQCSNRFQTKIQKVYGANYNIYRIQERKTGRRGWGFFWLPILNKVKAVVADMA